MGVKHLNSSADRLFFRSLFRLTSKEISKLRIADPLRGESTGQLPSQRTSNAEYTKTTFPCHDVIITKTLRPPPWRLELPVNGVFVQQFGETDNNETSKVRVTVSLRIESTGDRWFPAQRDRTRKMFPFDAVRIYQPGYQKCINWPKKLFCE